MHYSQKVHTHSLKPSFKPLDLRTDASFNVKIDSGVSLMNIWHYHPEVELIFLKGTAGTRIIGTSVERFSNNDVCLIGKNLPHAFLHEDGYLTGFYNNTPQAVVIQFDETFLGREFLSLPELKDIQNLFHIARQGLCLTENSKINVIPLIERMSCTSPLDRIITLLEILKLLVSKDAFRILNKEGFVDKWKTENDDRIQAVIRYTTTHFDQNIKIETVACVAHLTKESFCRYFKMKTGKTYMEFLIEFRVGAACKKLIESEKCSKEIAFTCGFDSLSNFHYHFKKIMKQSPLEYRSKCISPLKSVQKQR